MIAPAATLEAEADRLLKALLHVDCEPSGRRWNYESCLALAPLTLEINRLKREKDAVILTHSYVEPEIIYGVGDFKGDSYFLSLKAKEARAKVILFAGVVFMAETAKILSPDAQVIVPDRGSGCSLADSIDGAGVRRLKALHPDATVVCYINSTADVKAESDVCVTSGNVHHIVANLPARRILFVPDRLMGQNVRDELKRRGVDKEIITSDGTCMVHDQFGPADIAAARAGRSRRAATRGAGGRLRGRVRRRWRSCAVGNRAGFTTRAQLSSGASVSGAPAHRARRTACGAGRVRNNRCP